MNIGPKVLLGRFGRRLILNFALAGGTSPLARDLAESLVAAGHHVEIFSRSAKLPNVRDYNDLDNCSIDVLINLIGGHTSTLDTSGVENILDLSGKFVNVCMSRQIPLVHLSSGSVLGNLESPALSDHPRVSGKFSTKYQEAKVRIEELHDSYRHLVPISDLRLFSFAGPHFLRESRYFLSNLCVSAKQGRAFEIKGHGFLRDFTGPQELASAIELSASQRFSGVTNLFSSQPASRFQVLKLFREQFGLSVYGEEVPQSEEIYCASRSHELPGFSPRSSLEVISSESMRAFA